MIKKQKKTCLIGCFASLCIIMSVWFLIKSTNQSIPSTQLISGLWQLRKTGPKTRRLVRILLKDDEGILRSMNFIFWPLKMSAVSLWNHTCFIQYHGCRWLILNLPDYCLFIPVKLLGTLYPNKRLFHPLEHGVWRAWCCVDVFVVGCLNDTVSSCGGQWRNCQRIVWHCWDAFFMFCYQWLVGWLMQALRCLRSW